MKNGINLVSRWIFAAVTVSLLVNVLLAFLVFSKRSKSTETGPFATKPPLPTRRERSKVTYVTNAPVSSQLYWSNIESADYKQYATNLRNAGVPEEVITDIIRADLGKFFGARASAIRGSDKEFKASFWQHFRKPKISETQAADLPAGASPDPVGAQNPAHLP